MQFACCAEEELPTTETYKLLTEGVSDHPCQHQCPAALQRCITICSRLVVLRASFVHEQCLNLTSVLAMQGMKVKMTDMASKLGLGGSGNPFGALGQ